MSKFVICVVSCLLVSLLTVESSPVPISVPLPIDVERFEGAVAPAVPVVEIIGDPEPVRVQRSPEPLHGPLNGRSKSHHYHHHHHYRPEGHGHYGGGNEYNGNGGGSFSGASASAFSGSHGGYGGGNSGASASSNSISFQTPFGGVSASQANSFSSSSGGRNRWYR